MERIIRISGSIVGTLRAEFQQLYNRYFGKIERFEGDARQICESILERLWDGDFYRTSLGHFDFFFIRDFGTVAESLVKLGRRKHVIHTVRWALLHYRRAGVVTTCIDRKGNCFEAPMRAVDSLPWLLHCVVVCDYPLNKSERKFLTDQLKKYRYEFLDTKGYVKPMKFAEMRDAVMYDRSAYAVSLIGHMAWCIEQIELKGFAFTVDHYRKELVEHYWNGEYFNADRQTEAFSAECALFPFYLGVVTDKRMVDRTMEYINKEKLNDPYPLIYTNQPRAFKYHFWMDAPFMPHYESDSLWTWHAEFYLHVLKRYKRPEYEREYKKFGALLEQHRTFPEMLNLDGSWYYAPIYRGDPGMVWVALFLELPKNLPK